DFTGDRRLSGAGRWYPSSGNVTRGRIAACIVLDVMASALLVCALVLLGPQQTQPPASTSTTASATSAKADDLPVSLSRIQRALASPAPIQFKEQHPVFRLEIFGRKPTLEDILGEKFWVGPVSYGSMTHQEFLEMNTPRLAQPYAGFTGKYLVAE